MEGLAHGEYGPAPRWRRILMRTDSNLVASPCLPGRATQGNEGTRERRCAFL